MKLYHISVYILIALTITACGANDSEQSTDEKVETCKYSYNEGTTKLKWTSYKYSTREPVAGTFNEITVESSANDNDPIALIESIEFSIETNSVETENIERNGKISTLFFNVMNTPTITGNIVKLGDDGIAKVLVKMNDIEKTIEGTYTLEDNLFKFTAEIDVVNWNGEEAVNSLNTACKELHTGEDGVSKLWSEVSISLETKLKQDCD